MGVGSPNSPRHGGRLVGQRILGCPTMQTPRRPGNEEPPVSTGRRLLWEINYGHQVCPKTQPALAHALYRIHSINLSVDRLPVSSSASPPFPVFAAVLRRSRLWISEVGTKEKPHPEQRVFPHS